MPVTLLCSVNEELPSKQTPNLYRYQKSCCFVSDIHVLLDVLNRFPVICLNYFNYYYYYYYYCILGAFAKFRKATISFVISVLPSVRMEQLGSH